MIRIFSHKLLAIILFISSFAYGDIEGPKEPLVDPLNSKKTGAENFVTRASVEFAGGSKIDGIIELPSDSVRINYLSGRNITTEKIATITSVEFLKWKGAETSRNSFKFYPSSVRITFDNMSVFESSGNISDLNEFIFVKSGERKKIYSYFYEYRKNGRWINSREADMAYPETHPVKGTVVKITFMRDARSFDIYKFLPKIINRD